MHFEVLAIFVGDAFQRYQLIAVHDRGDVGVLTIDHDADQLHRDAQLRVDPHPIRAVVDRIGEGADPAIGRMHDGIDIDLRRRQRRRGNQDDA